MSRETLTAEPESTLTAQLWSGWSVVDPFGGRWWPSDEAAALIEAAEDPAAEAERLCREQPTLGTWHQ